MENIIKFRKGKFGKIRENKENFEKEKIYKKLWEFFLKKKKKGKS